MLNNKRSNKLFTQRLQLAIVKNLNVLNYIVNVLAKIVIAVKVVPALSAKII